MSVQADYARFFGRELATVRDQLLAYPDNSSIWALPNGLPNSAGTLALHAWWFNMTEGQLYAFNPATATFEAVQGISVTPTVLKGTALSDIAPARLLGAFAARPAF